MNLLRAVFPAVNLSKKIVARGLQTCVYCLPSHHHEVAARESAPSNGYLRVAVFLGNFRGSPQGAFAAPFLLFGDRKPKKEKRRVVYPALSGLEKQTRLKQTITCRTLRQGVVRKRSKIEAFFFVLHVHTRKSIKFKGLRTKYFNHSRPRKPTPSEPPDGLITRPPASIWRFLPEE